MSNNAARSLVTFIFPKSRMGHGSGLFSRHCREMSKLRLRCSDYRDSRCWEPGSGENLAGFFPSELCSATSSVRPHSCKTSQLPTQPSSPSKVPGQRENNMAGYELQ